MNNLKNIISDNRKKLNMTQRDLANKINVSDKQISKWETGISYPDITIINSLAKALNISVLDLLESEELIGIENEVKIDYNLLAKVRQSTIIAISSILFTVVLVLVSSLIGASYEQAGIILLVISLMLFFISITYLLLTNNKEKNKFSNYMDDQIYKKPYYYKNVIVILILAIPLLILLITFKYQYLVFKNITINQIIINIILLIILLIIEIPGYLRKKLNIKPLFKILNDVFKYSVLLVLMLLAINTLLINVYQTHIFNYDYLFKYIKVLSVLTKIIVIIHLFFKISLVYLIKVKD
ncbi:helix-turn-helix domain-containing protein [Haploplasma modicum]|uniref:helix-turn-helix domain-containing protein n=1 Tax=Haploplasma modicum TaxID=2150 RepID=UPI00047D4A4C|nr:helix-turn-helix transcriptional regulator [Haploplasma modicum]